MPGIRDTAYPQLKAAPSEKELDQLYTPELAELVWAEKRTREDAPPVGLLSLLKTFQRLGYSFPFQMYPIRSYNTWQAMPDARGFPPICIGMTPAQRVAVILRIFFSIWSGCVNRAFQTTCSMGYRTSK